MTANCPSRPGESRDPFLGLSEFSSHGNAHQPSPGFVPRQDGPRLAPGWRVKEHWRFRGDDERVKCYGRITGPRGSGALAPFSFHSGDHGVSGRGTATPSTRIASTRSLKKAR